MYSSGEEVQTLKDVLLMLTNPKNIPTNVSEAQAKKMLVGFIKRFITRYIKEMLTCTIGQSSFDMIIIGQFKSIMAV